MRQLKIGVGASDEGVTGDLMHHAPQCRQPEWSTIFDWDAAEGIKSRRGFLGQVAATGTFVLPIHFPSPTVGLVEPLGTRSTTSSYGSFRPPAGTRESERNDRDRSARPRG